MNFRRFSMTDPNIHLVGGNPPQLLRSVSIPPGLAGHSHQYVPHIPNINNMPHPSSMLQSNIPPALPPRLDLNQVLAQPVGQNQAHAGVGMGMGSYSGMGMSSYGGMGMGSYGMGGYGGYGGYGMGGMGGMYGGYNRFGVGGGYGDADSRFIQIAEESSRPAFESIQSCVNAVGSVAMMLESTFFAITSSFRAILGVAENASRLKSLFAQVWSTFAVIRTLNWIIRKLMVIIGIRTENEFKAWAEAVASTQQTGPVVGAHGGKSSGWPVVMFFGVLAAAPYVVLKMLSRLNKSMQENLHDPSTWQEPIRAYAKFSFTGTSPQELSVQEKQHFFVAPTHLQPQLWNSGWLMASLDGKTAGLVPTNYIRLINPNYIHDCKKHDRQNSVGASNDAGYSAAANNAAAYNAAAYNAAAYSAAANNAAAYNAAAYSTAANNAAAYSTAATNAAAYSPAGTNAAAYGAAPSNAATTNAAANNAAASNATANNAAANNAAANNAAANNTSNVRQG